MATSRGGHFSCAVAFLLSFGACSSGKNVTPPGGRGPDASAGNGASGSDSTATGGGGGAGGKGAAGGGAAAIGAGSAGTGGATGMGGGTGTGGQPSTGGSNGSAVDVKTVGSLGGALRADGVTVTIPAGALTSDTTLTLSVGEKALVTVSPDVVFMMPAKVKMDPTRWPALGPRLAEHETGGEFYLIGPVIENTDGSWEYETTEFSTTRGQQVSVASTDLWLEGDCSVSTVEATQTVQPAGVMASDVTKNCLKDMTMDIGPRHDPVNGPNQASRDQDEYGWMTAEAAAALSTASAAVKEQLLGYDIWVNGAWDSSGGGVHSSKSNHYYGAALDLALCKLPCADSGSKVNDPTVLGLLPARLLNAGFTWVYYEDPRHIHASISSPSLTSCEVVIDFTWSLESVRPDGTIVPSSCAKAGATTVQVQAGTRTESFGCASGSGHLVVGSGTSVTFLLLGAGGGVLSITQPQIVSRGPINEPIVFEVK